MSDQATPTQEEALRAQLSFYEFLGDRLGIPGAQIPHLAELIRSAPS